MHVWLLSAVSYLVAEHPAANERLWWDRHWHPEQSRPEISDMVSVDPDWWEENEGREDRHRQTCAAASEKTGKCSCSFILSCTTANLVNHSSPSFWTSYYSCVHCLKWLNTITVLLWIHTQFAHFTLILFFIWGLNQLVCCISQIHK